MINLLSDNDIELEKLLQIKRIIDREIKANKLKLTTKRYQKSKITGCAIAKADEKRQDHKPHHRPLLYFIGEPYVKDLGYVITHIREPWIHFEDITVWAEIENIRKG